MLGRQGLPQGRPKWPQRLACKEGTMEAPGAGPLHNHDHSTWVRGGAREDKTISTWHTTHRRPTNRPTNVRPMTQQTGAHESPFNTGETHFASSTCTSNAEQLAQTGGARFRSGSSRRLTDL
ncbi:hypothetical protein HYQ46_008545 [Verticillium longisporum]|nr:hypothetical protein HYQ46_008545 [Verticillium longisporum]